MEFKKINAKTRKTIWIPYHGTVIGINNSGESIR